MYIRTHTHTQARTHTTKFSGQHVVHFFTLSLFFFSSSLSAPFGVSTRWNYLVRLFFTALVVQEKQTRTSRTIVTSQHRCTRIRSASPSRDKHSVSFNSGWIDAHPLRSEPTLFFFFCHVVPRCGRWRRVVSVTWGGLARKIPQHACYYITRRFRRCTYFWKNARQHAQRQKTRTHTEWKERWRQYLTHRGGMDNARTHMRTPQ